jgi:hypothetical protein
MKKKTIAITLALLAFTVWQFKTFDNTADRDQSGEVTEGGQIDAFEIQLGDCLNNVFTNPNKTTEFTEVSAVPCSKPHEREVYAEMETKLLSFDEKALTEEASTFCRDSFIEFIGMAYEDSALYFDYFFPTKVSWMTGGDRNIQCLVGAENYKKTIGTLKNSMK